LLFLIDIAAIYKKIKLPHSMSRAIT